MLAKTHLRKPNLNGRVLTRWTMPLIHGHLLTLLYGIGGLLVSLDLLLFLVAIPRRYVELNVVAAQAQHTLAQLELLATHPILQRFLDWYADVVFTLEILVVLIFCSAGGLLVWRKPRDCWALFVALAHITYVFYVTPPMDVLLTADWPLSWLANFMQALGIGCALIFFYLLPDGRLTLGWTRPLALAWGAFTLIWGSFPALPFNLARPFQLSPGWFVVYLAWLLTAVLAQFHRYRRRSSRTQRQQTKSVARALVIAIVAYMVVYGLGHLLQRQPQPNLLYVLYDLLHMPLMLVLILPIPLAITVSIYRYHLFDMQFVLNRALVYSVLMALLTVVFFSAELALQLLFPMLLGDSLVIVVGAAVLATLTLHPFKYRVQNFVDRRFFRHKYNAAQLVAVFSQAARNEINLARLATRVEGVIAEALHPIHVLTWLTTPGGYALYLDTNDPAIGPMAEVPASDPFVAYCLATSEVIEIERLMLDPALANSAAVQMLQAVHVQLVAPLLTQDQLVGWLGLGRRTSGQPYSHDDLQLLNTLAAQVSPALRVAQMVAAEQSAIPIKIPVPAVKPLELMCALVPSYSVGSKD